MDLFSCVSSSRATETCPAGGGDTRPVSRFCLIEQYGKLESLTSEHLQVKIYYERGTPLSKQLL